MYITRKGYVFYMSNNQKSNDNEYVFNFYTSGSADGAKKTENVAQSSGFTMDGSNYNLNGQANANSNYNEYRDANAAYAGNGGYAAPYSEEEVSAKVQNVMAKTFAFMFAVLLVTAVTAYATANSSLVYDLVGSNVLWYSVVAAELITVVLAQAAMKKNKVALSGIMLFIYSVVNGMTLSIIFLTFDIGSIVSLFVLAAMMFGALAVFGLVTKRDLSALGSVGIMLLVGIILLSVFNIFIKSSGLSLGIAAVGLAVFIGLTAYDVQKIKALAKQDTKNSTTVLAMFGALMLYLDLINIFLYLLRLFGRSND